MYFQITYFSTVLRKSAGNDSLKLLQYTISWNSKHISHIHILVCLFNSHTSYFVLYHTKEVRNNFPCLVCVIPLNGFYFSPLHFSLNKQHSMALQYHKDINDIFSSLWIASIMIKMTLIVMTMMEKWGKHHLWFSVEKVLIRNYVHKTEKVMFVLFNEDHIKNRLLSPCWLS